MKRSNILQCSLLGTMSPRRRVSPSSRSSAACVSAATPFSLRAGLTHLGHSPLRKSSQVSVPASHMAISFLAPTDGISWKVCSIIAVPR